jgi:hypothetical protein
VTRSAISYKIRKSRSERFLVPMLGGTAAYPEPRRTEMRMRTGLTAMLAAAIAALLTASSGVAAGGKKPSPPHSGGGSGSGFSTTSTYVKNYANVLNGVQYDLTPEDVQATPDGGWIALGSTPSATNGVGVAWLLKASAVGAPQWEEEVGCLGTPPGDYSDELSLQQTSDGGYVLAGGTIGCGSGNDCPSTSGIQCGLIEKLDSTGRVLWAHAYTAGEDGTAFEQIEPTSDGGFVAVGSASDANHDPGALIVKLDGSGNVQWQRVLGPTATSYAFFNSVQQTTDGGYVAAGAFNDGEMSSSGLPRMSVLAAKFDAAGNFGWQRGFNDVGATGVTATEHVNSVVNTSDGGFAIGGDWNDSTYQGTCCQGPLLLKLTSNGSLEWQRAYSGGVECFTDGAGESCTPVGGGVYSLHQTADAGYVLAGDSNLLQFRGLVPWLAKVDNTGALIWQKNDYQVLASTGAPLSEYFASSALTPVGPAAIGYTENYSNGLGELLGVQSDTNGNVGTCAQVHPASALSAVDPGLVEVAPALTEAINIASQSAAPVQTQATSATATSSQC